ncbi:TPA: hypothetical protein HA239_01040 [Candidatus Woesearchaeota archaeon]|nr:hypothetical protein QT06_C0001G0247 [archaeon GW2011_AR15]MBS3103954.1 hypothetical protein [Candidatus Woesearchaeota archaeon]HIH40978.1 hypothetical protein [Candidatus Woesearchaeota archaeon]
MDEEDPLSIDALAESMVGTVKFGYDAYHAISDSISLNKSLDRWVRVSEKEGFLRYGNIEDYTGFYLENGDEKHRLEQILSSDVKRVYHISDKRKAVVSGISGLAIGAVSFKIATMAFYQPFLFLASVPVISYSIGLVMKSVKEGFRK